LFPFYLYRIYHNLEVRGRSDEPDPIPNGEVCGKLQRGDPDLSEITVDPAYFFV
jgi:hypothetical protein